MQQISEFSLQDKVSTVTGIGWMGGRCIVSRKILHVVGDEFYYLGQYCICSTCQWHGLAWSLSGGELILSK